MSHGLRASVALACFATVPSCGGRSGDGGTIEASAGAAAVPTTIATGGSESTKSLATGGRSDQGATGGSSASGTCAIVEPDWAHDTCDDLGGLTVRDPLLTSTNGRVMPGDTVVLNVTLADTLGAGISAYPGVLFQSSDAGVTFGDDLLANFWYALPSCQSLVAASNVQIASSVAPGSVVQVTALAALLGQDCPNAPRLVVRIAVD